ncbi:DNA-binding protein [candidate division KSB1 bacterium]|nr:DNA-binding protein [candidate division KSB1 bacterium]
MKYSEAKQGRVFVIRLEDGDVVHECVEHLAHEKNVQSGALIILGAAEIGSQLVVGPQGEGRTIPIEPNVQILDGVHDVTGTGTLFRNEDGEPKLHLHMAAGRADQTLTGCIQKGVKVWRTMEVVLFELKDTSALRKLDSETGFHLLEP